MADIDKLFATPGEKILDKWNTLIRWIRSQQIQAPGATTTYGPNGAKVVFYPDEYVQNVRFRVVLKAGKNAKVTVGEGTVNGKLPKKGEVPITGDVKYPAPEFDVAEPDDDFTSFVCIKTSHNGKGDMIDATIECKKPSDIPGRLRADYIYEDNGYIPIAIIRHDPKTRNASTAFQHSVHNLQCRMYNSGAGKRFVYWAA